MIESRGSKVMGSASEMGGAQRLSRHFLAASAFAARRVVVCIHRRLCWPRFGATQRRQAPGMAVRDLAFLERGDFARGCTWLHVLPPLFEGEKKGQLPVLPRPMPVYKTGASAAQPSWLLAQGSYARGRWPRVIVAAAFC
jgi:hypothetical protein